jgi:Superinfection immunity protein
VTSFLLSVFVFCALAGGALGVYLLPVLIGWARRAPDLGAIVVINILLGWTFAGWVVALALAFRNTSPGSPMVQVVQNLPSALPPASSLHSAGWAGPPGSPSPHRDGSAPPLILPPRPPVPGHPGQP